MKDGGFFPSRTNYRISRSDFEKACQLVPISGPRDQQDGPRVSLHLGSAARRAHLWWTLVSRDMKRKKQKPLYC